MINILVVDDKPKARKLLAQAAVVPSAHFVTAASAKEALEAIASEDFDLIITDLKMETSLAGLDVLKAAKEKDPYTQVIVITAFGTPEASVQTMSLGAFDYLEKNAPGTEVFEMIASKVKLALDYRAMKIRERDSR